MKRLFALGMLVVLAAWSSLVESFRQAIGRPSRKRSAAAAGKRH